MTISQQRSGLLLTLTLTQAGLAVMFAWFSLAGDLPRWWLVMTIASAFLAAAFGRKWWRAERL